MKINKTLGRVATTFLATAMLASVTAVPAFAEGESTSNPPIESTPIEPADGQPGLSHGDTFNIAKYLEVPKNANTPAHTYTFNIKPATDEQLTDDEKEKGIEAGVEGGVPTTADVTFIANAEVDSDGYAKAKTPDLAVTIGENGITHAGSYKYFVTEAATTDDGAKAVYDDVNYDENQLVLYVHVKNNQTDPASLSVDFIELVDPNGQKNDDGTFKATKIDGFKNVYGEDGDESDKLYDIVLKKVVTGDQANLNAMFKFAVAVDSEYDNDTVLIVDTNKNGTYGDIIEVNGEQVADEVKTLPANGTAVEIELSNDVSATIFNLTDGSTYTIKEVDGGKNGYTTTVDNGHQFTDSDNYTVSGKVTKDDKITYTNVKTSVTPTGLAMDIAPYALLVVVAAAGCFVFLRKRNED